jgi:transcriptional regulator with XRE-family HTH domain
MAVSSEHARLRFGRELRRFRKYAGLSQHQLAKAALISQAHLSAIERGTKGTSEDYIRRFDSALSADGQLWQRWKDAFRGGSGWPDWVRDYADLEVRASEIHAYHPLVVPGLLQTPAYAKTLIRSGNPQLTDAEVDEQAGKRIARQAVLTKDQAPHYVVILDELWLRRPLGSPEIMREQIDRLLATIGPRVEIQVIPARTRIHPGIDGAFHLLTVKDGTDGAAENGRYLHTEIRGSGTVSHDPQVVADYTGVFSALRGAALPIEATRQLLTQIQKDEFDE